jgi:hypothetical protein
MDAFDIENAKNIWIAARAEAEQKRAAEVANYFILLDSTIMECCRRGVEREFRFKYDKDSPTLHDINTRYSGLATVLHRYDGRKCAHILLIKFKPSV